MAIRVDNCAVKSPIEISLSLALSLCLGLWLTLSHVAEWCSYSFTAFVFSTFFLFLSKATSLSLSLSLSLSPLLTLLFDLIYLSILSLFLHSLALSASHEIFLSFPVSPQHLRLMSCQRLLLDEPSKNQTN